VAIESFLEYLRTERRFSNHTVPAYETDLRQLECYLREQYEMTIPEAQSSILRSWIVHLMESGLEAASVKRKISTLKSFYRFCLKRGLLDVNPASALSGPKAPKTLPKYFEKSVIEKVLSPEFFSEEPNGATDRVLIKLLYSTGMRASELIGLRIGDIDFGQSVLVVTGKRNKQRMIPLAVQMIEDLREYLRQVRGVNSDHRSPLFVDSDGQPVNHKWVYNKVKHYFRRVTSQEKVSPHVLRHTFATHMLNNGAELQAVKELLGHASLAATQVYTHTTYSTIKNIHGLTHPRG
jgi:integrase/recombinase XerC